MSEADNPLLRWHQVREKNTEERASASDARVKVCRPPPNASSVDAAGRKPRMALARPRPGRARDRIHDRVRDRRRLPY